MNFDNNGVDDFDYVNFYRIDVVPIQAKHRKARQMRVLLLVI